MPDTMSVLAVGVKEAAKSVSMSPWTIRKLIRDGKLKTTRFSRRVLIEPRELEKLVATGRGRGK